MRSFLPAGRWPVGYRCKRYLFEYALLAPANSFEISSVGDRISLALFIAIGATFSGLTDLLRARMNELEAAKEKSDQLFHERQLLIAELAHRTRRSARKRGREAGCWHLI